VVPRPAAVVAALPREPGVYRFRDARDRVLYIGRAADLRGRVASYWSDLGARRHLRPMVRRIVRIEAAVCASRHEAAWLERNLLEARLAPWNRTPGGQETPVRIALDARSPRPGLRVLHDHDPAPEAARVFGPYLGGEQVRRAVAGLHRILPLAWTSERLDGTDRAMAAGRGVTAGDREGLATAVAAVLEREPGAVARARDELLACRDRAAAAAAFELAGRIHAELGGLQWVTGAQRVTALDGGDGDVCGWEDGVLVTFAVRDGRLCGWSQRPAATAAGVAAEIAATPPAWRDFARRNAELAAALLAAAAGRR
jgi:excinuclease ABC subunit C